MRKHYSIGVAKTRVRVTPRVRVRVRVRIGESVWKHNCIDDHATIIHPLLLLVLFSTNKKFSHRNCVLLRTKPGEKKSVQELRKTGNQ